MDVGRILLGPSIALPTRATSRRAAPPLHIIITRKIHKDDEGILPTRSTEDKLHIIMILIWRTDMLPRYTRFLILLAVIACPSWAAADTKHDTAADTQALMHALESLSFSLL